MPSSVESMAKANLVRLILVYLRMEPHRMWFATWLTSSTHVTANVEIA
jgi:hypothetical protein